MDSSGRLLVVARVKSVLRRIQASAGEKGKGEAGAQALAVAASGDASGRVRFGRCSLDVEARRMFEDTGAEVAITAMEYDLPCTFLASPNRVLSRDQLLMKTRNREWEPFDRSIDVRIGRLRKKIEPKPEIEPRCIRTVRMQRGYMYVPL